MNFKLTVQTELIIAAMQFAGKDDVRYYLNGVCFEISNTEIRLIGCNGHGQVVARQTVDLKEVPLETPLSIIVPRAAFEKLKRSTKTDIQFTRTKENQIDTWDIVVENAGVKTLHQNIEGVYPYWRRVVPQTISGGTAQFNPDYIAALGKVGKLFSKNSGVIIGHNGDAGALINFETPDVFAVLMPIRKQMCKSPFVPDWSIADLHVTAADLV